MLGTAAVGDDDGSLVAARRHPAPPLALLLVLGTAGVAAAAWTMWWRVQRVPTPSLAVALVLLGSLSYMVCGLVAWRSRPWSRLGPVMVAAGFSYLIVQYQVPPQDLRMNIALWLAGLPYLLLAWLILTYPTGRLTTWPRRLVVLGGATLVLPLGFLFTGPYGRDAALVGQALTFIAAAMGLGRYLRARGPTRRSLAPVPFASLAFAFEGTRVTMELLGLHTPWTANATTWATQVLHPLVPAAILAGLVSTRWARGGVGNLVVELEGVAGPSGLNEAIRKALRDPTLEVGYWVPERRDYVTADGRALDVPEVDDGRSATTVEGDRGPLAVLVHDAALDQERELLQAVVAAARLALENARLQAEVRAQLQEVRASRVRIVEAGDAERRRVERNLHDGAQQRLVSLNLALRMLQRRAADVDADLAAELGDAVEDLKLALAELRELARGIHPSLLTEQGLGPALESLAEQAAVPVVLDAAPTTRLPEVVEETAYYLVAETLANAAKHAHASRATVTARLDHDLLVVEVTDDGRGGADPDGGTGLRGLRDRVTAIGGTLGVVSPPGEGTVVRAELPCA